MADVKRIIAVPKYVYDATGQDVDWLFECLSKLDDVTLCCDVAGKIGLEEKLSRNDIMDMVVLNKYVDSVLNKKHIDLCGVMEEKVYKDLNDFSLQSMGSDINMSSMKNMNPWIFESRGDILFIILQDCFLGYMVKGTGFSVVSFLINTLSAYKKYYGESSLINTPYFKRFIGLVI